MESQLTVLINGDIELTFRKMSDLDAFIKAESNFIDLAFRSTQQCGFGNIANNIAQQKTLLHNALKNFNNEGRNITEFNVLNSAYGQNGPLIYSKSIKGQAISKAANLGGDRAAGFAYALITKTPPPYNFSTREDFIGLMVASFPEIGEELGLSDRLAAERSNYRSSLNRRLADFDDLRISQEREWRDLLSRALQRSRKAFKKRSKVWYAQQAAREEINNAAVQSIKKTESAYTEFMQLRAAVNYWSEEAARHRNDKSIAVVRLQKFFPISGLTIVSSFAAGAVLLVNSAQQDRAVMQFIVGGAIIAISTIIFWIGRILTKLYLSEHHLEQDANQRAVMITTYLALINENGATADTDRTAILSAIFRSTPDGIVKEDGPGDTFSVAGALSRLGISR